MRWCSAIAILLGGCSAFFPSNLPDECLIEDEDGDGFLSELCNGTDCDDTVATTHPGADELCNGLDDDCDGLFDEALARTDYWSDCDLDGFGAASGGVEVDCRAPTEPVSCAAGFTGQWVETGGDCDDLDATRTVACGSCAQVDFLIVMDTSASMTDEQINLAAQLPRVVTALKTGDSDGDGVPEAEPIADLHVGVVTPDLGAGGFAIPTCDGVGDDGILLSSSAARIPACTGLELEPPFLSFDPSATDEEVEQFGQDWACLVRAGTDGCGFEQHLEAALKALTPASSPIRFEGESLGQQDGPNRGFLREDSLLVVLVVSDEDDCSAADTELYDPSSELYAGDLNLRCHLHPEAQHPISRYVGGLLALRDAEDLIYATVTGVPEDIVPAPMVEPDYTAILADSRMQEVIDLSMPGRLTFSCNIPDRGRAFPPRRLLEVGQGLQERGSTTLVSSICDMDSYSVIASAVMRAAVGHGLRRCGPSFLPTP